MVMPSVCLHIHIGFHYFYQRIWAKLASYWGTKLIRIFSVQIGFGSNKKTRHMMPSGHKAFLVSNTRDVDLLLMHNKTFAAEFVPL